MRTFSQKPADVTRTWYVVDASEANLGRLCTKVASLLIGKGKPTFTSHVDGGDYVVVINADKLQVSGTKLTDKMYYRHSGHPGNLKEFTLQDMLDRDSTKVITLGVKGMLPKNKLSSGRLERLKVYSGSEHPHSPQQPVVLSLKETK